MGGERDERHISSSSLLSFRKINNIRVIGPGGVQLDNDKKFIVVSGGSLCQFGLDGRYTMNIKFHCKTLESFSNCPSPQQCKN